MSKDKRPIIVKKVIKKGHGHHGGSWKVAYADFVTAMMAFFMVMWILGMDEETRKSIEGYFATTPVGITQGFASGASPVAVGTTPATARIQPLKFVSRSTEEGQFRDLADKIEARLEGTDGLGKIAAQIEVVVSDEGLRIELIEAEDGETFFPFGSARMTPAARRAMRIIGQQLKESSSSPIVVEGHTDAARFGSAGYSNWELSSDRAQAARRELNAAGISPARIQHIRGYADRQLRKPDDPLDPSNRRTSILLPFSADMPDIQVGTGDAPPAAPGT